MVDLAPAGLEPAIFGPGVAIVPVEVGRIWLVSGVAMAANTVVEGRHWVAPDRVLVVGGAAPEGVLVSDVSDGYVVVDIGGARWGEVLAMGSTLAPGLLAPGLCAQTVFAGVRMLIAGRDGGIRVFVDRPVAAWLLDWLRVAVTSLG